MFIYLIKIISIFIFLLSLIFLSIKINEKYSNNSNKYMKILDIQKIGKNSSIVILKVGDEGVLLGVSPSNINKIKNIKKEDIEKMELEKSIKEEAIKKQFNFIKDKIK